MSYVLDCRVGELYPSSPPQTADYPLTDRAQSHTDVASRILSFTFSSSARLARHSLHASQLSLRTRAGSTSYLGSGICKYVM